jgi:hypothetical protein
MSDTMLRIRHLKRAMRHEELLAAARRRNNHGEPYGQKRRTEQAPSATQDADAEQGTGQEVLSTHPVDVLKHFVPEMTQEAEAATRALCDEVVHLWNGRPLRGGCLRAELPDGSETVSWPGDVMFSSVTMCATHYWSESLGWVPIVP